ncbi:MAG: YdcH family protein [Deltaproteobacteria bacterium]|nr:YdcH family protein [Deltaproteobacteria bacterium]
MPIDVNDPVVDKLLKNNIEFKEAYETFRQHRKVVEKLEKRPHLTKDEEVEIATLKKQKLALKDKMEHMINVLKESGVK